MLLFSAPTSKSNKKPRGFKPAGASRLVTLEGTPQFANAPPPKGRLGKGLRYQTFASEVLATQVDVDYPGPWLKFEVGGNTRWAQPDWLGFNVLQGVIYVVEMKLTRVPDAWWQLNRLYIPLLEKVFPKWTLVPVEVASRVAIFPTPEPVRQVRKLEEAAPGTTSFLHLPFGES